MPLFSFQKSSRCNTNTKIITHIQKQNYTMKRSIFSLSVLYFSGILLSFSQPTKKPFVCNYYGNPVSIENLCVNFQSYISNGRAEKVIGEFAKKMGLFQNKFKVMECPNTENCFATFLNNSPYIIYDRNFLNRVSKVTETDWAAISILAHEIGHHANYHTTDGTGSRPEKELEADYFSGYWLNQMGATLEESQEAMQHFQSEVATTTHPPRYKRLLAIEKGWREYEANKTLIQNSKPNVQSSRDKNIQSSDNEIIVYEKKVKKTGCIEGDCVDGEGFFVHDTQGSYKGEWREGRRHGFGIQYYPSGKKMFEGQYVNGKRNGRGKYYFEGGESYSGDFFNDNLGEGGDYFIIDDDETNNKEVIYYFSDGRSKRITYKEILGEN